MRTHALETTVETKPRPLQRAVERQQASIVSPQCELFAQVTSRIGDGACAEAHVSALKRTTAFNAGSSAPALLQLQRQYGNRYVQRVLAVARAADGEADASPELEDTIQRARRRAGTRQWRVSAS